jgi:hypothetical protein
VNITRNNAEAFFLDYYEGNLSEGQVAEMFAFLKVNPDLREVFESFSHMQLDDDSVSSVILSGAEGPDFSFLKKESTVDIHEQAQQWMVDAVDGTISAEDKLALENYLNDNPSKREDLAAFEKTILRADENETIGDLSNLKKEAAITSDNFEHYAIALIEGTISPDEKSLLESFVLTHPEYSVQLNAYKASVQKADESVVFDAKSSLKKSSVVVTKDNIEELLFDKSEGELSAHDEVAVDAFIAANPEYRKDLGLFAKAKLVADANETFEAKDKLKRGVTLINEGNFEQYLISASEGLLNREELRAFNSFVTTQPKYRKALTMYAATKLQPDMSVVYDDKEGLKRKEKGAIIWFSASIRYAAAAVLVIVLSVYFWMKYDNTDPNVAPVAKYDDPANVMDNNNPVPFDNNTQPKQNNSDQYAYNDNDNVTHRPEWNPSGEQKNVGVQKDVNPVPEENILVASFTPVTIIASSIPNGANEGVTFSGALYDVVFNDDNKTQPVAENPADDYITPGQLAMRWMKDKIDGTDPEPEPQQDDFVAGVAPGSKPAAKDKNVDGLDITESAVDRVGQSAANGNIAMEQRNDGTYLQLWNYEVRVAK